MFPENLEPKEQIKVKYLLQNFKNQSFEKIEHLSKIYHLLFKITSDKPY